MNITNWKAFYPSEEVELTDPSWGFVSRLMTVRLKRVKALFDLFVRWAWRCSPSAAGLGGIGGCIKRVRCHLEIDASCPVLDRWRTSCGAVFRLLDAARRRDRFLDPIRGFGDRGAARGPHRRGDERVGVVPLGPGAYSIDARLFGRRVIVLSDDERRGATGR